MGKKAKQKFRRQLKGRDPPELPSTILEEVADAKAKNADRIAKGLGERKVLPPKYRPSKSRKQLRKAERIAKKQRRAAYNQQLAHQHPDQSHQQPQHSQQSQRQQQHPPPTKQQPKNNHTVSNSKEAASSLKRKRNNNDADGGNTRTPTSKIQSQSEAQIPSLKNPKRLAKKQRTALEDLSTSVKDTEELERKKREKEKLKKELDMDGLGDIFEGMESDSDSDIELDEDPDVLGEEPDVLTQMALEVAKTRRREEAKMKEARKVEKEKKQREQVAGEDDDDEDEEDDYFDDFDSEDRDSADSAEEDRAMYGLDGPDEEEGEEREAGDEFDEEEEETEEKPEKGSKKNTKKVRFALHDEGKTEGRPSKGTEVEDDEKEDIYGRKKGETPYIPSGKYIPPSMRAKGGPLNDRIVRQLRGQLNKIALSNIEPITTQIEAIYSNNISIEVTEALASAIISDCKATIKNELLLLLYAAVLTVLHHNVGMEVGGHILEKVVHEFKAAWESQKNSDACNYLLFIANLYNFGVISSSLVYDILKLLITSFNELEIELILLLVANAGAQLRADEPASLKEIVLLVQERAIKLNKEIAEAGQGNSLASQKPQQAMGANTDGLAALPSRVKFMIEAIYDLKNNKQKNVGAALVHLPHLKKAVRSVSKHTGAQVLRISWETLTSGTAGRWWMVGSAYAALTPEMLKKNSPADEMLKTFDSEILALAKRQRMTSDLSTTIFCIIVTGEDYLDTFEKLLRLNLKNKQDREIVHVLMHCCLQEKVFNEYYAHLAIKLCSFNNNFKFTFQFSFWDKFKQLETLPLRGLSNLCKLLAFMVLDSALSLAILKAAELVTEKMKPNALVFFRMLFQLILVKLTEDKEEQAITAFKRIATILDLEPLREQIMYFFQGMKEKIRHERVQARKEAIAAAEEGGEGDSKEKLVTKEKERRMLLGRMRLVKKLFREHAPDPFEQLGV